MAENQQNELMLLENVFLKLGLAETDEQLEKCLSKFLCPVLLKLTSKQPGVQEKIMEMLGHINKRLKSRNQVALPVDQLVAQYCSDATQAFVTNFTIIYLKIGFPRLETTKKLEYMPALLKAFKSKPVQQQSSVLQLILPCFDGLTLPKEVEKRKALLGVDDNPDLAPSLLEFMLNVLLLPYNHATVREKLLASKATPAPTPPAGAEGAPQEPVGPPAGLDETTFLKLVDEKPPTSDELERIKLGILTVLSGEVFPEPDVLCHLIVASADNRHNVATAADREIKRIVGSQDWNNAAVVRKLYSVFQGTVVSKAKPVKPELRKAPANIQMRLKIMPYLLKSKEAANQFPACLQVTCDCLFGSITSSRMKHLAVQFIHHMCFNSPSNIFKVMGPVLLSSLTKLIKSTEDDAKLRAHLYVATAKIARQLPHLVANDIALLQSFFEAVCKEDSENRLAVQEALSLMSSAFTEMTPANQTLLEALILQNVEKPEQQARRAAVQYAHTVFPPNHIPSRYVLLLATGDRVETVASEAKKSLSEPIAKKNEAETHSPAQKKRKSSTETDDERNLMPAFHDMVKYIQDKAQIRIKSTLRYTQGNHSLPYNPACFTEMLLYLQACLAYAAGLLPNLRSERDLQAEAPVIAEYVKRQLSEDCTPSSAIMRYINMLRQLLTTTNGSRELWCLLQIVAVARETICPQLSDSLDWMKNLLLCNRQDTRELAAELYALVLVFGCEKGTQSTQLTSIIDGLNIEDKQAYVSQHGWLLCLGHVLAYTSRHQRALHVEDMETEETLDSTQSLNNKVIAKIAEFLASPDILLSVAACTALGETGRACALPVPQNEAPSQNGAETETSSETDEAIIKESEDKITGKNKDAGDNEAKKDLTKKRLVDILLKNVQTDNVHNKLREASATALGYMCIGEEQFPYRTNIIEGLLDSSGAKQIELHMTVGEALVCAALASHSPLARDLWLQSSEQVAAKEMNEATNDVEALLKLLMIKYIPSLNPHTKQAACIWLWALTRQCGEVPVVQKSLLNIQHAFMGLLSENDEITQDIASKGLAVVYEKCSKEQKQTLVSSLVDTLSSGKKATQKVQGNTQLFGEGALGKTPDGKSLTTYRELCSIANDLNQPDLIYKFMHLANHQACWNSKKGAAFGFSTIAAQAGEQLAPYLHKIVPKLYRYQFDPNAKIQLAMTSIWNALVNDNKKTVDKYQKEIIADLLVNLTHVQWRVRESSCLALSDFLRGRNLDDVIDDLPELWKSCFRVLDDIKETVRKAAEMACRSLSKASIKVCDPNQGKIGVKATSLVLPCLIEIGLANQVKEVRGISLATILKISKTAGVLLKPHIPLLVYSLLEALSSLEPQYLNYLSLHVASDEEVQNKLDSARAAASKTSPMMDCVNLCIPHIDDSVMRELVPRLVDLIKSSVGLSTKTGCADFIIQLCTQCFRDLQPYTGKLLLALLNGLSDRNVTIKKRYGSAIGHLVKIAKESSVEKLILKLKSWYLEKEDDNAKMSCAVTVLAITRRSVDVIKAHGALVLPIAFLGMHEKKPEGEQPKDSENPAAMWEEVWSEATPGTEAGVKLYLKELVELAQSALDSNSWHMKAQGAAMMETIATKLGKNLEPPHLGIMLTGLVTALSGRTWTGKEALLKSISTICVSCKESLTESREGQPTLFEITEALLKECRKTSIAYKMECITYTGEILEAHSIDRFKEISEILFPMLQNRAEKDEDISRDTWLVFEERALTCLRKAWPEQPQTQEKYCEAFHDLLLAMLKSCVWKVEVELLKTYATFIEKLCLLKSKAEAEAHRDFLNKFANEIIPLLCKSLGNAKYGSIRTEAMAVLEILFQRYEGCDQLSVLRASEHEGLLKQSLGGLSTDIIPGIDDKAQTLLRTLNKA